MRELPVPTAAGLNRVGWDLRSAAAAGLGTTRGPFVLPGTYAVVVRAGGHEAKTTVPVVARRAFLTTAQTLQAGRARIPRKFGPG